MLDGRVKTLHPRVHGGLLYIRGKAEHESAVAEHGILPIDMVVVNLYAFEKTAAQPGVAFGHLIENIDIGGPSMVRSAAKNFEDVAIVTSASRLPRAHRRTQRQPRQPHPRNPLAPGQAGLRHHRRLRHSHRQHARPDSRSPSPGISRRSTVPKTFPQPLASICRAAQSLRYGENPHQRAALYADGSGLGVANARQLQGKELSYNNLVDLDACWALAEEFS